MYVLCNWIWFVSDYCYVWHMRKIAVLKFSFTISEGCVKAEEIRGFVSYGNDMNWRESLSPFKGE